MGVRLGQKGDGYLRYTIQAAVSETFGENQSPCGQNGETWAEQPQLNGGFVAVIKTVGQ